MALLKAEVVSQVKMLFAHLLCPSLFLKEGLDSPIRTGNYVSISLVLFCTPGAGAEDVAEFVLKCPTTDTVDLLKEASLQFRTE